MVGVLSLQGGFGLHAQMCRQLGYPTREVREPGDLVGLGALILPGGESTTIGLLMERRGLVDSLREAIHAGLPVLATCAGAILLASTIEGSGQLRLGSLDITIRRNAYGSQVDSFETELTTDLPSAARVPGVFIRAPQILQWGAAVEVLARYGGLPVLVRQGRQVAATFHPELTSNGEIHRWFLGTVAGL